jgi:hypothetical protein
MTNGRMIGWPLVNRDSKACLNFAAACRKHCFELIPRFDPCDHRKQKIDPFIVNTPTLRTGVSQLLEQAF